MKDRRLSFMRQMANDVTASTPRTVPDEADWPGILHLAALHTLTPLLYAVYRREQRLPGLPASAREAMRQAYESTQSRAQWMLPEFLALVQGLSDAGIPFLILKGLPLIDRLYGDRGARPSYDIDFWVRDPGDVGRAVAVLDDLAYEVVADEAANYPPEHRHLAPRRKPAPLAPPGDYFHPRLPWVVEPHTSFWEERWWGLRLGSLGDCWSRHATVEVEGTAVPVLCDADNLSYLCVHQMLHILAGNSRLIHLYDIHLLSGRLGSADWRASWERAADAGLELYLATALSLANRIFRTVLPPTIAANLELALRGQAVSGWLRDGAMEDVLLQDWTSAHTSRLRLARLSALYARPWWRKPWAFVQPLARTAVPSPPFIRRKYGLVDGQSVLPFYVRHIVSGFLGYARGGSRN